MRINRTCKVCGKPFSAIKVTQFFCCRKCFKKDYYLRTRVRLQEDKQNPHYPIKKCSFCQKSSRLSFDPLEQPQLFNAWACPHCGMTNRLMWEYSNNPNSNQVIRSILVTFQSHSTFQINTEYKTYMLPVISPGRGNPGVIVMTCEKLDILDVQSRDRKRLLFS